MMMDTLILVLFVALLAPKALCQDVETRGTNDKVSVDVGGQSRTIYSQARPLSPHRMMHFGKRPINPMQPMISVPSGFNVFQNDGRQRLQEQTSNGAQFTSDRFNKYLSPYLLSIELDNDQTLQEVPQGLMSTFFSDNQPNRNLVYNLDRPSPPEFGFIAEKQPQQVARAQGEVKLMKLLNEDATSSENEDGASQAERVAQENGQVQKVTPKQQQRQTINVSTRSMQSSRGNTLILPKAFIPSLLFDRHGSSAVGFGGFNKKAEPKDNFFMHFGRK